MFYRVMSCSSLRAAVVVTHAAETYILYRLHPRKTDGMRGCATGKTPLLSVEAAEIETFITFIAEDNHFGNSVLRGGLLACRRSAKGVQLLV